MKAIITYIQSWDNKKMDLEAEFPLKTYISGTGTLCLGEYPNAVICEDIISIDIKPDIYDQETETWIKS